MEKLGILKISIDTLISKTNIQNELNSVYFSLCKTFLATSADTNGIEDLAGHVLSCLDKLVENSVDLTIGLLVEILPRIDFDENLEVMGKIARIAENTGKVKKYHKQYES